MASRIGNPSLTISNAVSPEMDRDKFKERCPGR
jgi:hypothetical protein